MCLTIPAKIISIQDNSAIIQDSNSTKKINITLLPDLQLGDWVLYTTDTAIKKISAEDAQEIIDLLETHHPEVDALKLSERYREIIKNSKLRDLNKAEIIYLLQTDKVEEDALFSEADVLRKTYIKDFICVHGIIEFSNYCKNDCAYCGLNKANNGVERYRMSPTEIIRTAVNAVNERGYKLLVLQSGDDDFYTTERVCDILREIKKMARVFIFLSIGERSAEEYKEFQACGASGVLLRFETANEELFKKIHPHGKNFAQRMKLLDYLKSLNYFIATGSLVGLPEQTIEDLADDILVIKKYANMATLGPFIPCENTLLANFPAGDVNVVLKMIAILRLITKTARIPVVTALETLAGEKIRKRALLAGANSLMFNLTPDKYRSLYKIYPNKFYQQDNLWEKYGLFKSEESYEMLEQRMSSEIERTNSN
jgi:biotin synthase